ncbi:MAG: hypothetical protein IPO58_22530 [Betaproteobacteria bacterium]|nr:hypothetical protein [Betaproteobacteria bacterium]
MRELMAHAYALEAEAAERYAEFAEAMENHNNREVAELFRKLARIELRHSEQILEEMGWVSPPQPPAGGYRWEGMEAPESGDMSDLHYLMQPHHALTIAHHNEQRAEQFFLMLAQKGARGQRAPRRARNGGGGNRTRAADRGMDQAHAGARPRLGVRSRSTRALGLNIMDVLLPAGWAPPIGYANGIAARPGRIVFIAGQVGWDARQEFHSADIVPQFDQALRNVLEVLAEAGGRPEHICRITAYCCDKPAYLAARPELGAIWKRLMGRHFPAMSMIFVSDLLDAPGKIELEATAVVPD